MTLKKILAFGCLFLFIHASAQNDLLLLKKGSQTIQTWVSGSYISFQFSNKQWLSAKIRSVIHDPIIVNLFTTHQVANQFGLPKIDTGWISIMKLHINEIIALPKKRFRSGIITNGTLFQLGGGAFVFLNIFNSLTNNDPVFEATNLPKLIAATGVFIAGKILALTHSDIIKLGRKHKLITFSSN